MPDMSAAREGLNSRLRASASLAALVTVSLGLLWPASLATSTFVEAKTPGKTYCFYRVCHRVMTLEETRRALGRKFTLRASHYDDPRKDRFNPTNLTSSGEWFRAGVPDNAASPKLPNGTVILAWNPATKQSAVLRINNAGPYWGDRTLDVSRAAAERLGFARQGVATLHVQILHAATREDVAYRKGRRYAAVPGYIGTHATFELALADAGQRMNTPLTAPPTTLVASNDSALPPGAPADAQAAELAAPVAVAAPMSATAAAIVTASLGASLPEVSDPDAWASANADLAPLMPIVTAAAVTPVVPQQRTALAMTPPPPERTKSTRKARLQVAATRPPALRSLNAPPSVTAAPVVATRAARPRTATRVASAQPAPKTPPRPQAQPQSQPPRVTARPSPPRSRLLNIEEDAEEIVQVTRTPPARRFVTDYTSAVCVDSPSFCDSGPAGRGGSRSIRTSSNRE